MDNLHIQEKKTWPFWKYFAVLYGIILGSIIVSFLIKDIRFLGFLSLFFGFFITFGAPLLIIIFAVVYLVKNPHKFAKSLIIPLPQILVATLIIFVIYFSEGANDIGFLAAAMFFTIQPIITFIIVLIINFIIFIFQGRKK